MNILKLQNSISWEYHKWNNAVLFLEQILTWISKVVIFAVYLSSCTHINQFRTHTRKLVASYRKMKDLELNLAGVNVAILPVGKQHDIVNMKFLKGFDKDTEKKSSTCDESGAHDRISLWHLLTKFEKLEKSEFWKDEKKLLKISSFCTCVPKTIIIWDIIILRLCTTNSRHMMYGSWYIKCDWHTFLLFWAIFLPFYPAPPNNAENLNFEKIKKASRDIIILHISTINKKNEMMYDSWYGAQQTELFLILHQLLHFLPWS